jgi:hypothetical protein
MENLSTVEIFANNHRFKGQRAYSIILSELGTVLANIGLARAIEAYTALNVARTAEEQRHTLTAIRVAWREQDGD